MSIAMPTSPPFKLASSAGSLRYSAACCDTPSGQIDPSRTAGPGCRRKLADLDTHFQCSVVGTCLTTAALRKLMSRFIPVQGIGDLEIHHEAVLLAAQPGPASKALHKTLDHQHAVTLLRFARVTQETALATLWEDALRSGDIPGAYWAVLTHRHAGDALRKKVFGDVHMLSHLVGAANRADIRRLQALEKTNAELREQLEQLQERQLLQDQRLHRLQETLSSTALALDQAQRMSQPPSGQQAHPSRADTVAAQVALQTQRREAAEQAAASAQACAARRTEEAAYLRRHAATLGGELAAAEAQLRALAGGHPAADDAAACVSPLAGRRILYVGGRPSSTPAIRALAERQGGDFRHHDGGLEDRKGLLAASVRWAELVVFPVDCVDHDSVGLLKRLCARHAIDFRPLRSAGVGCFAAALEAPAPASARSAPPVADGTPDGGPRTCRKHG